MAARRRARRIILWAVPLLLLAAGLVWALTPKPVPVDLTRVETGTLQVFVEGDGRTRVREVYEVSAPVGGLMERVPVEAGDAVIAGETTLAVIRPADPTFLDVRTRAATTAEVQAAEANVAVAENEVERAEAQYAFARAELERIRRLAQEGTVAPRTLDRAQADFQAAQAGLNGARESLQARRSELAAARARLIEPGQMVPDDGAQCCVTIRAPVDGEVLQVRRESSSVVQAGTVIMEVGDPGDLEVVVDLLSSEAVRVRPGMPALLEDWGGNRPLRGVVRRVEPFAFTKVSALGIEEQRVNVVVVPAQGVEFPAQVGHGFRVIARIEVARAEGALVAPLGAVFRSGEGWAVFRVEDGVARLRPVAVGLMNDRAVEVTDGLEAGDVLVLHPSDRVRDGVRVERRTEA